MRRWLRRFTGLLLLVGLLALLGWLRTPEQITDANGARVRVMDGDSLRIGDRVVRLADVDAVELRQLCKSSGGGEWSCGLEARAALEKLVARGGLACASRERDRYGRAISRCSAQGSPDIAADLVTQGWALSGDGRGGGPYVAQQDEAKKAERGIWRATFMRPADWRREHPRGTTELSGRIGGGHVTHDRKTLESPPNAGKERARDNEKRRRNAPTPVHVPDYVETFSRARRRASSGG